MAQDNIYLKELESTLQFKTFNSFQTAAPANEELTISLTNKASVLVTFDSMKNPNSGYFTFGRGLGEALIRLNRQRLKLQYYLFRKNIDFFDKKVAVTPLSRLHNFFFPSRNKFDLVHFTDQTCRLRPYRVKAKKIMTVHDINMVHLKFKPQRKIDARINKLKAFMSHCDRIVTISKFVADDVLRYIPEVKDKLRVIYNGADKLIVPNDHSPAYLPNRPFLFTVGLLSVQKGFHLLPPLLNGNDFELVISGIETPHKARIIEEAEKFGVRDRVTITGPITDDDKAWYFKNCAAFLFPSIAEGFGLPVIEAMNFGKPVFLSKFTSLPEVGGSVAYYFDNFDPAHMQEVFNKGMSDHSRNRRAEAIMTHAAKFSWEETARQYLDLYNECLNE